MIYARIRLQATDYTADSVTWSFIQDPNVDQLNSIYRRYCEHKKFQSVMPIFASEYTDPRNDIIGYWQDQELVAFSIIRRYDHVNAEAVQFAWTYSNPKSRLGVESLKTECAIYRDRGFDYLYLDQADDYKREIQGFEILGVL